MYLIIFSGRTRKSLRKYAKGGSFPDKKFEQVLQHFRSGGLLPPQYRDHQLAGHLSKYRELHLASDILVQYERDDVLHFVTIAKIGTHGELFGE